MCHSSPKNSFRYIASPCVVSKEFCAFIPCECCNTSHSEMQDTCSGHRSGGVIASMEQGVELRRFLEHLHAMIVLNHFLTR